MPQRVAGDQTHGPLAVGSVRIFTPVAAASSSFEGYAPTAITLPSMSVTGSAFSPRSSSSRFTAAQDANASGS